MSDVLVKVDSSLESLVGQVADEFLRRQQQGERPDIEEYAARHPEAAALLRNVLASLQLIDLSGPATDLGSATIDGPADGTLGDFRLLHEIGRGGMGVVYEAKQISLNRRVALKVLPFAATLDQRQLQRFKNEAVAAAQLDHPHIVDVLGVGSERGVHYYAMRLIEGHTLAEVIDDLASGGRKPPVKEEQAPAVAAAGGLEKSSFAPRKNVLSRSERRHSALAETAPAAGLSTERSIKSHEFFQSVARLAADVAQALDHAHQQGIIHRDIKPSNLMLDSRGNIWVTDFGLAHVQGDKSLTMTGDLLGTLRYMSPEQALAKRVVMDHRTDIYSLGATLYELLTLQPAYPGKDREELLRQIAFEEPKPPRRINKAIPAEIETIVLKAMEKNPADRYTTAQELADDLRRLLRNEPIRARRTTVMQRARKWAARHRALGGAAALVLLLAVTMLAGTVGWVTSYRAARRSATEQVVTQALEESASWQKRRRLPEALSAARRAAGLVAGGEGDAALRSRVQARLDDLDLISELEEVRLQMTAVKDGHFDFQLADRLYGEAFRRAGLDVESRPAEETGDRIQGSSVGAELAAALDHWALMRQKLRGQDDPSWKHLLRVARLGDLDEWRDRVRDAMGSGNRQALIDLARSADALRQGPSTLATLALALRRAGAVEPALALLEQARKRHAGDFWVNLDLAEALKNAQRWDEAIRFHTAAVALRPQSPGAHLNLGVPLKEKGRLEEAIAECQEAIRLKDDYPEAHDNLGNVLVEKGLLDEAIAEYEEAIRLKKDFPEAHNNLGVALAGKDRLNEAMAEFRKAIRLKNDYPEAHYNLGNALRDKDQPHEAIAEYQEAIRLKKDNPRAHYNLGLVLLNQGRFADALTALKRGHELGSKDPRWHHPSAEGVRRAEKLVALESKLSEFLNGNAQPADASDRIALAQMCQLHKGLNPAAARFYADAFVAQPKLAEKLGSAGSRYDAACVAALAGCGQGKDAKQTDGKARARLRRQALDWLRADLAAWRQVMEQQPDKAAPVLRQLRQQMQHWQEDADLAGVRGPVALGKLPADELSAWQKLWADVAATLAQTHEKVGPEKKSASK